MKTRFYSSLFRAHLVIGIVLFICGTILAQNTSGPSPTNDSVKGIPSIELSSFEPQHAGIGDLFTLTLSNASPEFIKKLADTNKVSILFAEIPFRNTCCNVLVPATGAGSATAKLQFDLAFGADNRDAWSEIIRRQRDGKPIPVGLLLADGTEYSCSGSDPFLKLIVLDHAQRFLAGALLVLFVYLFLYLATQTQMIRDSDPSLPPVLAAEEKGRQKPGKLKHSPWLVSMCLLGLVLAVLLVVWCDKHANPRISAERMSELFIAVIVIAIAGHYCLYWKPAEAKEAAKKLNPYSLARTQMAIWFFLIVCSWVFLWLVTGTLDTLTTTVLALMGIGAGTALGAEVQDSGKPRYSEVIDSKIKAIEKKQKDATALASDLAELPGLQEQLKQELAKGPPTTEGFFTDVLTDARDGISFHRFQMFVWTIVLGIVFAVDVYQHLVMPDFDGTMLALMGISSGTYLGFMIKETHPPQATG
ncbi:MAG: hypothetical protein ABSA83_22430 [Verrucomicrobiota bacterium]